MTEVKRANGTSSLPLKKPPSFSHSSSSYKHIYDDVFASPPQSRQQFSTIIDDDYAEIFGSSRSNNGTWNILYSSIPVLDLPPPSDMRVRSASGVATVSGERPGGEVDYGGVFGGDEYGSFGLPGGEELFEQLNKKAKSSSNAIPRRKGQTMETTRPEILRQSQNGQTPKSDSCQPVDSLREFEQIKNEDAMKRSSEISKTAPARDYSVDTYEREEAVSAHTTLSREVPVINDGTRLGKDVDLAKKHGKHSRRTSSDLENVQEGKFGILKASFLVASNSVDLAKDGKHSRPTSSDLENVQEVKFGILKASGLVTPNSVDTSHDTSQSTAESTNSFFQPSDSIKPFDDMNNEMLNPKTSEATCAAEVHAIHESTSSLHEVDSVQNNLSSEMPALKDETKLDFNPVEEQGKHSRNTSSELGESKRSDLHSGFQYKSSESISLDTSQDTHLTSPETGLSNMIDDDVPINLRRKKGRHSRITSLDLGDRKHSCDRDGNFQRKPRFGGSYSFDASRDPGAARVKVQPSMMAPSSSVPQFFPVESRYKISENSSWRNFGTNVYRDAADSPPSLDSQLDMNSAAAISASALQRALEEAAMTIQLAKEYLEREGQGSSKLRFKDTLKVYGAKDEQLANEMDKYQQTMMHDYRPPVDTGEQKLQFLKRSLKVKVENDNQLAEEVDRFQHSTIHGSCSSADSEKEKLSLSERSSALENHHPSPVSEQLNKVLIDEPVLQDQKKTVQEEESTKETIKHEYISPPHSENDRLSVPERTSVLETGPLFPTIEGPKFVKDDPVFQDQKKLVPDKECIDERNLNMSKLIDERDRQEGGGEWEAKKHLNQLFYGVKNKIASFMAWQTDTETKEVSNETEAGTRSQLQSEEAKPDSLETENGEVCAAEKNQDASGYLGEHVEMEIGFLSEPVEPYENDSVCSNTSGEEKAESSVDLNPGVAASVAEDIMFYPFRTERVCPTDTEEGVRGSQGCTEIEFTSVREQVLNEMKYEQLQAKSEEHCEMLDYICYKDSAGQADMYRHVDSNTEETNEILEEPHSLDGKDRNETTNEEDPNRSMDEECRDETIPDSYCTESTAERIEEKDNCGHEMMKETENWQHDADILKETYLEEIHGCREIERDRSQRNHTEVAADHVHGRKSVTDVTPTYHIEKIDEEVAQKASCNEVDEDVFVQTKSRCDEVTTEEVAEEATFIPTAKHEPVQTENDHIRKIDEEVAERASCTEVGREVFVQTESRCNEVAAEVVAEEATFIPAARDELVQTENDHVEDTTEQVDEETNSIPAVEDEKTHTEIEDIEDETDQVAQQATCSATFADVCQQTEDICFSEPEDPCGRNYSSKWVEEAGPSDETRDRIMEIPNSSVEPKMTREETVLFYDSSVELGDIAEHTDVKKTPQFEKCVLHSSQSSIQSAEDESTHTECEHIEDATEQVAHQEPCSVTFEDDCQQTENVCLSEAEEPCSNDESSARAAEPVTFEKKYDRMMHFPNPSLEPKETVQFYDSSSELDEIIEDLGNNKTVQFENFVLRSSQSGVYPGKGEVDAKAMESESGDILQNQTKHVHEEALNVGEVNTLSSQDAEKDGVEAVPKRRRWFNNGMKVDPSERPNILEGDLTEVEIDQEVVDESVLAGSVEIHADELHSDRKEVLSSKDADPSVNSGSGKDTESTPKRRRWFVKRGEEGLPVPPPLFQGIDINLEEPNKFVNETLLHSKSDSNLDKLNAESGESLDATEANVAINGGKDKTSGEAAPRRKRWFESGENVGPAAQMRNNEDAGITMGTDEESKVNGGIENHKIESMPIAQETEAEPIRVESVNDRHVKEMNKKEREKEKEKLAVERAIREARERAFAEARERAKRDALERPNAEVRQRGAHEKVGKVPAEGRSSSDKAAMDAKLRTERAAVERATAEARERAMQKALSEKTFHRPREQAGRIPTEKNSSSDPSFQSSSSFSRVDLSNKGGNYSEKYDGVDESAERRKARLERQSRTMERAANALEEKNRRDLLVQKEQAAKNMMADSLDAEVKRWCTGKEGNLRVLLSTLQYILGPESGWQAISLTDLIAATAVRKAYKKASLCVHPDKLQQRGATIQQKYICEKVYDLLKEAWSKFNPDDR